MHERNYTVDFLRLTAILAVILIHTTNSTFEQGYYNLAALPITFFLNQFSRFAVGVFFAISGYLLATRYNAHLPVLQFYKRRVSKLIIPYIFWSAFYYAFFYHYPVSKYFSWPFLRDLLTGDASYQLYFIPAILVLYLLFPFIMRGKKIFLSKWFISIFFLLELIAMAFVYYTNQNLPFAPPLRNALIYSLPFLCGAAFAIHSDIRAAVKKHGVIILCIAGTSLLAMMGETWTSFYASLNPDFVRSQWRITTPIYALSMALVLARLHTKYFKRWDRQIFFLSALSMGVFFCHVLFISVFWRFAGSYLYSLTAGHIVEALWFDAFEFLTVTTISFVFVYAVSKVRVIRTLLGARLN